MTSVRFDQAREAAREEMAAFDRLSPRLRAAIKSAPSSVRATTVWAALVRGVSEEKIIETIEGRKSSGQKD